MEVQKKSLDQTKKEAALSTERTRDRKVYVPRVDIAENDAQLEMFVNMPGADEKSVNIMLEKDILTIEAEVEPPEMQDYTLAYAEYGIGDYSRKFTLSEEIDREKIQARMKNGVLRIILPKVEPAQTRKITISAGE